MEHAKVGSLIKILDTHSAQWVNVGDVYRVLSVGPASTSELSREYILEGVDKSWYARTQHFEILEHRGIAKTHPNYHRPFKEGDTVCRWRDVEGWEWEGIGAIDLPPLGKDLEVESVEIGRTHKECSFYIEDWGWYPMKAFVLSEYYNTTTNRGTAELNTSDYGKVKSSIEVQRPIASIVTGQRRAGSRVQGRRDAAVVRLGHLSYKAITGK